VSDNGSASIKALAYLERKFHVKHICISGYNSTVNGIVEHSHFDLRQALFKAADGDQTRWSSVFQSVVWADRVTTRRQLSCSPYFAATGTHPLLPLDIVKAIYLVPPPAALLDTTQLIASRAIALQKRREQLQLIHSRAYKARVSAAKRFKEDHSATLVDHACKPGDLVLICNTAIEKALNRKMLPRYVGPLIVIAHNLGGAYILAELDGSVFDQPTAAFRVVPYLSRRQIPLPDLTSFIDISLERLQAMKDADVADPDADDDLVDDEDSDTEEQTIALLRSPALHSSPSHPAHAAAFPSSMFLVSTFAVHLRVIPASCVPDSLSLSLSTNQNSSVTPCATPYGNSGPQISMPTLPFHTNPTCNNLSTIYSVGIPVKFHCTLFLPPLLFLRTPPSTLSFPPLLNFFIMPGSAMLSQCCMVATHSSPARKFLASVNAASDQTCVIDTSLPVCLISEVAAARCSLSIDTARTAWIPTLGDPELVSVGLAYNVPLEIDCLHFVLQFYVVRHCLVDAVLGQPFLHCASATLTYRVDGSFSIILSEPGRDSRYFLETLPIPNAWDVEQVLLSTPARGGVLHLGTVDDLKPTRTDQTLIRKNGFCHFWLYIQIETLWAIFQYICAIVAT